MQPLSSPAALRQRRFTPSPWLLAGVIAVLLLFGFYVQTLRMAVERGRMLQQTQRVADTQTASASPAARMAGQRMVQSAAARRQIELASAR